MFLKSEVWCKYIQEIFLGTDTLKRVQITRRLNTLAAEWSVKPKLNAEWIRFINIVIIFFWTELNIIIIKFGIFSTHI